MYNVFTPLWLWYGRTREGWQREHPVPLSPFDLAGTSSIFECVTCTIVRRSRLKLFTKRLTCTARRLRTSGQSDIYRSSASLNRYRRIEALATYGWVPDRNVLLNKSSRRIIFSEEIRSRFYYRGMKLDSKSINWARKFKSPRFHRWLLVIEDLLIERFVVLWVNKEL